MTSTYPSAPSPATSAPSQAAGTPTLVAPLAHVLQLSSPLVSTQWLADHLGSETLAVLDATVLQIPNPGGAPAFVSGDEEYLVHGHVPGAVFADILQVFSDPNGEFAFTKPSAQLFEHAAASVGVDNRTTVIVYDNSVGHWAARIWWLFRAFGYDQVAVLDGGLKKWIAEDRPTDVGYVAPRSVTGFSAIQRPEFWADKAYVASIVSGNTDAALICAVPPKEFIGEYSYRARAGHIPGSVSAPASHLVDRETNAFLPLDTLRARFDDVTRGGRPVVTYCGGGIAAASDALALALIGHTSVAIYDGSLNEWAADTELPIDTTA